MIDERENPTLHHAHTSWTHPEEKLTRFFEFSEFLKNSKRNSKSKEERERERERFL
jgi:hypothetical protein